MPTNRSPNPVDQDPAQQPSQSASESAAAEHFPNARYFQVHFQHLHENNQLLQSQLNQLTRQVELLSNKLERISGNAPQRSREELQFTLSSRARLRT